MYLRSLYLQNFRTYSEALFEFSPQVNAIFGPNAKGKTTILEAIYFLISGRSFRTAQMADFIKTGFSYFFIEAIFLKKDVEQKIKFSFNGFEKKIIVNTTPYPSTASLLGLLKGVIISPDDVMLVKGSPNVRRHFLDIQIAQIDPLYVHYLSRYNKAMKHRNALLKIKNSTTIENWEYEMSKSGAYVILQRMQAVLDLQREGEELHNILTGQPDHLSFAYKSSFSENIDIISLTEQLMKSFSKSRKREMEYGATLTGPHRDDLLIQINNKEARFFASEGQQRSCVSVLKLAEWQRIKRLGEDYPLLLIDDVGMSLDESRRSRLLEYIQNLGQVFLTATQSVSVPAHQIPL